ncbi:hypothetical protein ASPZODRAFT_135647 [Penicilliopsis zonata CBS 506.65]|uniref:Uncharacterized protein n=1 Tax=Penicilliopsis zonata CBS 506.65 TaxID=1073090 RepID=A0A1L9SAF9_9EURO|nr:hypothetical protein ASPZODRAFT_135647 [Penicilliopsis zonata CBS 506.65]OJJ44163.1 hypothetical protein ASPZODRAFT_135647 [Penicilliopsis zonata CBS 506.65]
MPKLASAKAPPRTVMRCLLPFHANKSTRIPFLASRQTFASSPRRPLAQICNGITDDSWLTPSSSTTTFSSTDRRRSGGSEGDHKPPDERTLKLGKTLRTLSPLLPTILFNPLPPELLSPSVTLHLFPSTHPHLPTVKGRTLYRAALWTVPVAWGSVPIVGNIKLQILSERIVRAGTVLDPGPCRDSECGDERLVVRWKTEPKDATGSSSTTTTSSSSSSPSTTPSFSYTAPTSETTESQRGSVSDAETHSRLSTSKAGTNKGLSMLLGGDAPIFKLSHEEQFTGLFIFSFDEKGRILTHTIEHADNANGWERTSKFVALTDWLIGKARESLEPSTPKPGLAMQGYRESGHRNCFSTGSKLPLPTETRRIHDSSHSNLPAKSPIPYAW